MLMHGHVYSIHASNVGTWYYTNILDMSFLQGGFWEKSLAIFEYEEGIKHKKV